MVSFPTLQIIQQNPTINPSGSRHLLSPAAGFLRQLNTVAGGELNFGSVNTTGSGAISDTLLFYARVSNFGSASGVYSMRFYWHNTSSFAGGTYRFLEKKDVHFAPNIRLDSGAKNTPTIAPNTTNLSGTITPGWTGGSPWISGIADGDASMYVWLALEIGSNVPVGQIGGAGLGTFRGRILYDFS